VPHTPARHFAKGKSDPAFGTKPQIGADLAAQARAAGFAFRPVAADSAYGDQDGFRGELREAGLPSSWPSNPAAGPGPTARMHTPVDAARALGWRVRTAPHARWWSPPTRPPCQKGHLITGHQPAGALPCSARVPTSSRDTRPARARPWPLSAKWACSGTPHDAPSGRRPRRVAPGVAPAQGHQRLGWLRLPRRCAGDTQVSGHADCPRAATSAP